MSVALPPVPRSTRSARGRRSRTRSAGDADADPPLRRHIGQCAGRRRRPEFASPCMGRLKSKVVVRANVRLVSDWSAADRCVPSYCAFATGHRLASNTHTQASVQQVNCRIADIADPIVLIICDGRELHPSTVRSVVCAHLDDNPAPHNA